MVTAAGGVLTEQIHPGLDAALRHASDRNGNDPGRGSFDDSYADAPPPEDRTGEGDQASNSWEPMDLGPYLRGEVEPPQPPSIGIRRATDLIQLIYARREHVIVGDTESGKTWLALACAAVELAGGNSVVYIHYEEPGPESTIERLRLLGISDAMLTPPLFRFIAPNQAAHQEWIKALLAPAPALVIHDGVNEAMSLHGHDIDKADGAATFRRRLIVPFLRAGAATIACDHLPMGADGARKNAYGSVHKGNAIDGARIALENREPFGRGLRGRSNVFVTKDRPGHLRAAGKPTKTPGKTFFGTFIGDDSAVFKPFALALYAPKVEEQAPDSDPAAELADTVREVIAAQPDRKIASLRALFAEMRKAGHQFTEKNVRDAVDDLIAAARLSEVVGKRGAKGYQSVSTAAEGDRQ
jgi:hypothetical protein